MNTLIIIINILNKYNQKNTNKIDKNKTILVQYIDSIGNAYSIIKSKN